MTRAALVRVATGGGSEGRVVSSWDADSAASGSDGADRSHTRPEVSRKTDDRGRFEAKLEPGFYDVCVRASAFTPECKKVLIEDGKSVQYRAQLKVDPLLVQHLADRFIKKKN